MHKLAVTADLKKTKRALRQFWALIAIFLLILNLSHFATAASSSSCVNTVSSKEVGLTQISNSGRVPKDKVQFFKDIATAIQMKQTELKKILLKVNNLAGAELEFQLVNKLLSEELPIEIYNISNSRTLENAAVYGSTNVPLYTLIAHGVLVKSFAKNVWFRTPEITREIYIELFETLKTGLPDRTLEGLHLLTENRDVQYDNFNKMYVMGLSKKGTRRERLPSELVVFTGNPSTAKRLIDYNQNKIQEEIDRGGFQEPFRQVLLAFGAGINPMVIVKSAKNQMDQVVRWSMEPAQINNGQDCMAADFFAVDKAVEKDFVEKLLSKSRELKPGPNNDPRAGFTPLTMNKNFEHLKIYREKYKKYLLNPEATFDLENKMVGPHIFVFPYSMFKQVEIREHFAPFYVIFSYQNSRQLYEMIRDERVQDKAMYATVLGGPKASADLVSAIKLLKENRHNVIVNETLFGDLHPNMPFGGKGPAASMIVVSDYNPKGGLRTRITHQPKLISKEVFENFGENQIQPFPSLTPTHESLAYIENLKRMSTQASRFEIENPQEKSRPTGLDNIRVAIQELGLKILVDMEMPSAKEKKDLEELFGSEVVFMNHAKNNRLRKVKGVLLHNSNAGEEARFLNSVRGDINPHIGWQQMLSHLSENKLAESHLVNAYSPGLMAKTETFSKLYQNNILSEKTLSLRKEVLQLVDTISINAQPSLLQIQTLQIKLTAALESLLKDLRKQFPEGGYLKNFSEFATADLGNQITTFSTSSKKLAHSFIRRFLSSLNSNQNQFDSIKFQSRMKDDSWDSETLFVNQYLLDFSNLIVQSRVKIAQTPLGFPAEFRVDFIDGSPIHTRPRFSHEYLPQDLIQAEAVINDFFKKLPPEFRYLPGGADVARLQDGKWVIIEFNFGSTSGTLSPEYFTFEYHQLISKLKGRKTPWLSQIDAIFESGIEAQIQFLKTLKHLRPVFYKSEGFKDLSVFEAGQYFRNLYLKRLGQEPNPSLREKTFNQIHQLLTPWKEHPNIIDLLKGAESYIKDLGQ